MGAGRERGGRQSARGGRRRADGNAGGTMQLQFGGIAKTPGTLQEQFDLQVDRAPLATLAAND